MGRNTWTCCLFTEVVACSQKRGTNRTTCILCGCTWCFVRFASQQDIVFASSCASLNDWRDHDLILDFPSCARKPELMKFHKSSGKNLRWRAALAPRHVPLLEDHTTFGDQRSTTHHTHTHTSYTPLHTLCHIDASKNAEMANLEKSNVTHELEEIPCDSC